MEGWGDGREEREPPEGFGFPTIRNRNTNRDVRREGREGGVPYNNISSFLSLFSLHLHALCGAGFTF